MHSIRTRNFTTTTVHDQTDSYTKKWKYNYICNNSFHKSHDLMKIIVAVRQSVEFHNPIKLVKHKLRHPHCCARYHFSSF